MDKRTFLKRIGFLPVAMLPAVAPKTDEQAPPPVVNNITVNQHVSGSLVNNSQMREKLMKEIVSLQRTGRLSLK